MRLFFYAHIVERVMGSALFSCSDSMVSEGFLAESHPFLL